MRFTKVGDPKVTDNGIEVNYINGGSQEILKIDFIFNAGNLFQTGPLIASSTNQLMKEGTKKYSSFEILRSNIFLFKSKCLPSINMIKYFDKSS